jgi:type II secretory pathway pseudopilin PulG
MNRRNNITRTETVPIGVQLLSCSPRRAAAGRRGFTWPEFIIVMIVLAVAVGLIIPAVQIARENARRTICVNNLKYIDLAIHNYTQTNRVLPPGTICATAPIAPANQYDVWGEAAQNGPGFQGTSFLLRIKPFIGGDDRNWQYSYGIMSTTTNSMGTCNAGLAETDFRDFYCPVRRAGLRTYDRAMMLSAAWTGGGTDYGGCTGRHAAFTLQTGYNICDASMHYQPEFRPVYKNQKSPDTEDGRWGVFGRVNQSTKFDEIKDGLSTTILTGELQRITAQKPTSKDGWTIGGPATLFTTGAMFHGSGPTLAPTNLPKDGRLMNNGFFGSPGSDHPGGVHFGMGDGAVRFINLSIDPNVFSLLGSMADGVPVDLP